MRLPLLLLSLCPLAVLAAPGDLVWRFAADDIVYSSPAMADDGTLVFCSHDGIVYALNADGSVRWTFDEALDWFEATPTITPEGLVLVGSWNDSLYALDLATGEPQWSFTTSNYVLGSVALHPQGFLVLPSSDGSLYALTPQGEELWQFPDVTSVESYGAWESSPAISAEGMIYVTSTEGWLVALDSEGALVWSYAVTAEGDNENAFHSSPALDSDGAIYVGNRNGNLYAFEANGDVRWTFAAAEGIDSSPVIGPTGELFFGARDGYLYALDTHGVQQWELLIGDVFFASPAVDAAGNLYLGSYVGDGISQMQAVDVEGSLLWTYSFEGFNDSSPLITPDGDVVFGAHNGEVYRLEAAGEPVATSAWPLFGQNLTRDHAATSWAVTDEVAAFIAAAFPDVFNGGAGWYQVNGFGNGWFYAGDAPWLLHLEHGWIYYQGPGGSAHWFYDTQLEWLYMTDLLPHWYYQASEGRWLMHSRSSSIFSEGEGAGRWFYDEGSQDWFLLPPPN